VPWTPLNVARPICSATRRGRRPGRSGGCSGAFEVANHGTVYLDEIGALPIALAPRLLHTLRTGEVSRTGSREIIRIDVHVIASTVHNATGDDHLWPELRRLDAAEICILPLRQRTEEISVWASFFLEQFNRRYRRDVQLCPDVIAGFMTHAWPGNIRELEEAVRRLVVGGGEATGSIKLRAKPYPPL